MTQRVELPYGACAHGFLTMLGRLDHASSVGTIRYLPRACQLPNDGTSSNWLCRFKIEAIRMAGVGGHRKATGLSESIAPLACAHGSRNPVQIIERRMNSSKELRGCPGAYLALAPCESWGGAHWWWIGRIGWSIVVAWWVGASTHCTLSRLLAPAGETREAPSSPGHARCMLASLDRDPSTRLQGFSSSECEHEQAGATTARGKEEKKKSTRMSAPAPPPTSPAAAPVSNNKSAIGPTLGDLGPAACVPCSWRLELAACGRPWFECIDRLE
ncbi:hypothetical protein ANO11243_085800 [Dothideomycetidae sp. 11243]|nr:hypothetical protein ANO11243_085800 [fungal sp. No.11243]